MAAGNTILEFHPLGNEPPATNYATYSVRNQHPVLEFTDNSEADKSAIWTAIMPRHYGGNGLTVYIHFAAVLAVGDVDWDVSFERIGDEVQDLDVDGFAAIQSVNDCAVPANPGDVSIVSVAFTDGAQIDNIAVGESFRIRVTRGAAGETGGTADKAQLVMIELRETV